MLPDVIVIGGGLMGCLSALRLAQCGLKVTVLERSVPGAEASTAAAGILAPGVESHDDPLALRTGLASRELHGELADELQDATGIDIGFRRCGVIKIALNDDDAQALAKQQASLLAQGCEADLIDKHALRQMEPSCSERAQGGLVLRQEAQVQPRALLQAVALAAERAGARFVSGATVRGVRVANDRVVGVELDAEQMNADHVVVAAGSWTSLVPGLQLDPNAIFPVKGQMIATRTRPPLFQHIVFSARGYIVTRPDGQVLCGATEERVGFRRGVTFAGIQHVIDIATQIAPTLAEHVIESHWSNFRPGTRDGLPLVGATSVQGLYIASGHFRNGILLGPITARWIADAVTGAAPSPDAAALRPTRFETSHSS